MVIMNGFNRTHFEIHYKNEWETVKLIFGVEIVVIVFNILHTLFFLWINITAKQFHQNWTNIMSVLYIQHIIASCFWIVQKSIQISDSYEELSSLTNLCSYIRVACVYQGLMVLPILIIERYCALVYIINYEHNMRLHISAILISILFLMGCISTYAFHELQASLLIFPIILLLNAIGISGNMLLLRTNKKRYYSRQNSSKTLNLGERYQITENIKISKLINVIFISMGGFNGLICLTLLIDNFDFSFFAKNLSSFAFDISALAYSTLFPYICMSKSERWAMVFKKCFRKIFGCNKTRNNTVSPMPLRNTLGEVMNNSSGDLYFHELSKYWNH